MASLSQAQRRRASIVDTDPLDLDLRGAVVGHFADYEDAPVKQHLPRFKKIAMPRMISLVLLIVMVFAIHLPFLIIAGSDSDTYNEIFRSLSLVAAFFTNLFAITVLNRALTKFVMLQVFFMANFFCMVFELALFHIGSHHSTLIPLGIIAVLIRTTLLGLAAYMAYAGLRSGVQSEELYTRYMDKQYTDNMFQAVDTLALDIQTRQPKSQQEVTLLASMLGAIVKDSGEIACGEEAVKMANSAFDSDETRPALEQSATLRQEASTIADEEDSATKLWKVWNCVHHIRRTLYHRDQFGHTVIVLMLVILLLLTIGNFTFEFVKIFANQTPLFDDELNDKYNNPAFTKSYMPQRTHSAWKVHLVVVDGLRYDHTEPGASSLGNYVNTPAFLANSRRFRARAQLPSFSVPNWMSILTGAVPETHGVTGNLLADETKFDHIFRQAKEYGVHAGMTGTPWWSDLVFSTLPSLDGDGTVDASFVPEGWPSYSKDTSDPADWTRHSVALKAATRSRDPNPFNGGPMYEFFLTHYSDVDKQGHEYGIDTEWNTDNSYFRAIDNKTTAIDQLINTIDSQTVLIITSDHGHVKRGGHGGVSQVLRDVPVIFYTKNRPWTTGTNPQVFRTDNEPRVKEGGAYQNLDLCATICALLGIPSPRQSVGIFMEEVIEELVPAGVRLRHYYDLFMAKRSSFLQYREMLSVGLFNDLAAKLDDADIVALSSGNGTSTKAAYGEGIRKMNPEYVAMRDLRLNYIYLRNLFASLLLIVPFLLLLVFIFDTATVVNIEALFKSGSPCTSANRIACMKAFATVFLYTAISIAVFLIAYFPITGYTVWDSTLTHTTSVATTYLSTTIAAPIFCFILLTKAFLFPTIEWRIPMIFAEIRSKLPRQPAHRAGIFFNHVVADLKVFIFAPSDYKPHKFQDAYLYIYFLAFWTAVVTFTVMIAAFPFTWVIPIVFSTEHVTEFNLEHRFRVITVMMILVPLQAGTALLLYLRPEMKQSTLLQWDNVFIQAHLEFDLWELQQKLSKLGGEHIEPKKPLARSNSINVESVTGSMNSNYNKPGSPVGEDAGGAAPDASAEANGGADGEGDETAFEIQQRIQLLQDCLAEMLNDVFRISPTELFLSSFWSPDKTRYFKREEEIRNSFSGSLPQRGDV